MDEHIAGDDERTVWTLAGVDRPIEVTVSTREPAVVAAIEDAAARNGLELRRIEEKEET